MHPGGYTSSGFEFSEDAVQVVCDPDENGAEDQLSPREVKRGSDMGRACDALLWKPLPVLLGSQRGQRSPLELRFSDGDRLRRVVRAT